MTDEEAQARVENMAPVVEFTTEELSAMLPPHQDFGVEAAERYATLLQNFVPDTKVDAIRWPQLELAVRAIVDAELAGLNRLQQVSELHAGQVEGWKEEVAQLEKLAKDRWVKIETLEEKVATARNSARQDAELIEELRKQYDDLLDEHEKAHIHAARQEGFIDAIRELRPQPKRRKNKALDLVEATIAAMPKRIHVDAGLVAEAYGSKQERLAPWYRRRHV